MKSTLRLLSAVTLLVYGALAWAESRPLPASWALSETDPLASLELLSLPAMDLQGIALEDELQESMGRPPRFALAREVQVAPSTHGRWQIEGDQAIWRLRVRSSQARTLSFAFKNVHLPADATLYIYSQTLAERRQPDRFLILGPFDAAINKDHGEFWTPMIAADDVVIEINLPLSQRPALSLALVQINHGYRGFNPEPEPDLALQSKGCTESQAKSGSCNMDVACLGDNDPWNEPRRSVGAYTIGGVFSCSGALVNNTAMDRRMLFLTATHCTVTADNAASVVVYWNYEWPTCRTPGAPNGTAVGPPDPSQANSGARFLAATKDPFSFASCTSPGQCSDVTLLELDDPPPPQANVFWAGWDRGSTPAQCGPQRSGNSTAGLCASIHHPNVDEKRITFVDSDFVIGDIALARGVHWQAFWHRNPPILPNIPAPRPSQIPPGVTEPGSSGSALFNARRRIVGVLSGGDAFCGAPPTLLSDHYGALAHAWNGLGTPSTRIRDHLDPIGAGVRSIDGIGESFAIVFPDPDEPIGAANLPTRPGQSCPGFYVLRTHPGLNSQPGRFGAELNLLGFGNRTLQGGLNFGSRATSSVRGFAAFNIANSAGEMQRVSLDVEVGAPGLLLLERRAGGQVVATPINLQIASGQTQVEAVVPPGFYVVSYTPSSSSPTTFAVAALTSFVNRPGGGFQGGVVVGGYHDPARPFGASGATGFAGFCIASPFDVLVEVLSRPSYGSSGATGIEFSLSNGAGEVFLDSRITN